MRLLARLPLGVGYTLALVAAGLVRLLVCAVTLGWTYTVHGGDAAVVMADFLDQQG